MVKELFGPSDGHGFEEHEVPFRQLLDALPAAAYTCDPEGLITYFNRPAVQALGARAQAERAGRSILRFV